jgi:hypothetical protein
VTEPRRLNVGDIVGSLVVTANGRRLGPVVELVAEPGRRYVVTHLEIGRSAWFARYDLMHGPLRSLLGSRRGRRIPWADVAEFDGTRVTLKRERSRS